MEKSYSKTLKIGSISFLISIFAALFMCLDINGNKLGESFMNVFNLPAAYGYVGLILFIFAYIIGSKNKEDKFAKAGVQLSKIFITIYIVFIIIGLIQSLLF